METKIFLFLCVIFCHAYSSTWSLLNGGIGDISLDQKIQVGTATNVTCNGLREPYTSETLELKVYVDGQLLSNSDVRAINETAVSVIIYGDTPGKRDIHCFGKKGNKEFLIGKSRVTVGFPPKPVEGLRCVSENMEILYCEWTKPTNYVPTTYKATLVYEDYLRHESLSEQSDTAKWTSKVLMISRDKFVVEIEGVNVFGANVKSYEFSNYAISKPDSARNLKVLEDAAGLQVSWEMAQGPVSLPMIMKNIVWLHELQYRTHRDPEDHWIMAYNQSSIESLVQVRMEAYAHTNYTFRVRIRSSSSTSDYWSQPEFLTYKTRSKAPLQAPMMTKGSFVSRIGIKSQNITIFWKVLQEHQKNGPNFHYKASVFDRKTQLYKDASNVHVGAFASFVNLPLDGEYTFSVSAVNTVGSSNASSFDLPSRNRLLKPPVDVQVFSFGNGSFEVSWKLPKELPLESYNYTVFYCAYEYPIPYTCNGTLGWDIVPSYQTAYLFHSPSKSISYQYGVAVNTDTSSSGLAWASCPVLTPNSLEKIDIVWVTSVTNTTMRVHWNLVCSKKSTAITSVRINYCRADAGNELCIGAVRYIDVPSEDKDEGFLTGLEPFSTYKITTTASRRGILGLESDAIFSKTDEGTPLNQPTKVEIEDIGADMIIVSWEPPNTSRGTIRRYEVTVGKLSESTEETRIEFRGLLSYHSYEVKIAACTKEDRCGPTSNAVNATTDVNAPGRMLSPEVDFFNSTHLKITWDKPSIANGPIDEVKVKIRYIRDGALYAIQEPSAGASPLVYASDCQNDDHDVRYEFAVRASNFDQESKRKTGNWSAIRTFDCSYLDVLEVEPGLIIGVGIGGAVIVLFVLFVAFVFRRARISKEKPPINLPSVLKGTSITFLPKEKCDRTRENEDMEKKIIGTHIEDFTTGFQGPPKELLRIDSDCSDDGSNVRNTSAYSSTSSNDLLLGKENTKSNDKRRNPSAESSGKSSSAMSLLTSSSHVSSDSGTDMRKERHSAERKCKGSIELQEMKNAEGSYFVGEDSRLRRRTPSPTCVDSYVVAVPANSRERFVPVENVNPDYVSAHLMCPSNQRYVYAEEISLSPFNKASEETPCSESGSMENLNLDCSSDSALTDQTGSDPPSSKEAAENTPYVSIENAACLSHLTASSHGDFVVQNTENAGSPPVASTSPVHHGYVSAEYASCQQSNSLPT